jgi:hypothetical protein
LGGGWVCGSYLTGLKGMNFDHDFSYYLPLFSSLLKKRKEEKENKLAKINIKTHAFLTGHLVCPNYKMIEDSSDRYCGLLFSAR